MHLPKVGRLSLGAMLGHGVWTRSLEEEGDAVKPFAKVVNLAVFGGGRAVCHYYRFFFPEFAKEPSNVVCSPIQPNMCLKK